MANKRYIVVMTIFMIIGYLGMFFYLIVSTPNKLRVSYEFLNTGTIVGKAGNASEPPLSPAISVDLVYKLILAVSGLVSTIWTLVFLYDWLSDKWKHRKNRTPIVFPTKRLDDCIDRK